jgi:restriction system protein
MKNNNKVKNMPAPTIKEAIKQSIIDAGHPLSAKEAYEHIQANDLYKFGAKNPVAIVQSQLRKHTEGLNLKTGSPTKIFRMTDDKRYTVI